MSLDERPVQAAVRDHQVEEPIQKRKIGPEPWGEMDVGLRRRRGAAGVDDDQERRAGPSAAIQDPRPEDALGLGQVVADMQDGVGDVKVPVGARIPVAPERLDERQRGRRRAETCIAIHVRGTETGADEREGVILLK